MVYDLIIIGGGPAGVAAGVYAARKKLKTLIATYSFDGQSVVSPGIENWIGTPNISGTDLSKALKAHLDIYRGENLMIKEGVRVTKVEKIDSGFRVNTDDGQFYEAKAVLVTTGSKRRKLTIPGAAEYENKGITYCASCDGPLFAGKEVVVIGGGNAGFETAGQLLAYCPSVTLIEKLPQFRADQVTIDKLQQNPKFKALANTDLLEIRGDKFVSGMIIKNLTTGETKELPGQGVFVEIGHLPATSFVKDLVDTTPVGSIKVDPRDQKTSKEGIWAAGDCTDGLYHQNNIAAGDAIKALEDIYNYLNLK
ncbi:MAG: FAD-dependent oxidoreductase [Patescibacteria group bacterium]